MLAPNSGPYIKRIEALEAENELLRYRLQEFEESFGAKDDLSSLLALGFTPSEARILNLIRRREYATRRQMLIALYADDPDRAGEITCNIVSVYLSKMRPKLARLGLDLRPNDRKWGDGLHKWMSGPDKARLEKLIASKASMITGTAARRAA